MVCYPPAGYPWLLYVMLAGSQEQKAWKLQGLLRPKLRIYTVLLLLQCIGQSKSWGQPRFKVRENRRYLLMGDGSSIVGIFATGNVDKLLEFSGPQFSYL